MQPDRSLSSLWVKGKSPDEAKKLTDLVFHSQLLLSEITKILKDKLLEISNKETTTTQYDTPAWAYQQAHLNGMKQALQETINLLTLEKKRPK